MWSILSWCSFWCNRSTWIDNSRPNRLCQVNYIFVYLSKMKQKLLNSKLKKDITRIFCSANYWNGSKELDCHYYFIKVEKERAVILCLVLPQVDPFASGVQRPHLLIPFTKIQKNKSDKAIHMTRTRLLKTNIRACEMSFFVYP